MPWYYAIDGQPQGPVSEADFERLVAVGTIKSTTLVWRSGMPAWAPYASLGATNPSADSLPRTEASASFGSGGTGMPRPSDGARSPGSQAVPGPFGYGGFWLRFLARFIDGLAQVFLATLVGGILGGLGFILPFIPGLFVFGQIGGIAVAVAYDVYFIRKYDATPGKLALGLKVLRADGSRLSVGRIVGRYFSHILSALPLALGYIIAAFDSEKRALHDHVCETRVIKSK